MGRGLSPALAARHFSKSFGGARALDDASLTVERGEVHGLVGENGSGKSTLIRVLAGYHAPAPGAELEVLGRQVPLPLRPGQFRELGMSFVHQDLGLIASLSVAENLRLTELATRRRLRLSWRDERRRARDAFARLGLDLDPRTPVDGLTPVERALLAIVRALEGLPREGGGVLVLDEPTGFLPEGERRRLFELVRQAAAGGAGVLFVSHDLGEVREVTDRVTVLRDGRVVGTEATASLPTDRLIELIVGGPQAAAEPVPSRAPGTAAIRVELGGLTFELGEGEIIGLTGLAGSGFEAIPYVLFGARPGEDGRLFLRGRELDLSSMTPGRAMRAGLALLPSDRLRDGSAGSLSLTDNLTLPALDRYVKGARLRRAWMARDTRGLLADYDVRPPRPRLRFQALSGGNQQKAQLAKWLQLRPRLLLLDEPTRGVDVGARRQIMARIRSVAGQGSSVICSSSDYEELSLLCDRVLMFSGGRVAAELRGGALSVERIARECHRVALRASKAR